MTYLETKVFRFSTLSPIHIQTGRLEYGDGFIRVGQNVYVVDVSKLQSEIFRFGGLDVVSQYTETFSRPNPDITITQFLRQIGYNYSRNIKKISKGIVHVLSRNAFIRAGLGEHFIPGSSVKGAIKTAVLYKNIKQRIASEEDFNLNNFVEEQIDAYLAIHYPHDSQRQRSERENLRRSFAGNLLENAFESAHPKEHPWDRASLINPSQFAETITNPDSRGATVKTLDDNQIHLPIDNIRTNLKKGQWIKILTLQERDGTEVVATFTKIDNPPDNPPEVSIAQNPDRETEPAGPFTDVFKTIKVKDAIIEKSSEVQFEEILFTTLNANQIVEKDMGNMNRQFECFDGETTIRITIDHAVLDSFKRAGATPPFSDIKSLLGLCQDFAQAQWDDEKQFLNHYNSAGNLNLDDIRAFYNNDQNRERAMLRVGWGTGMLGTTLSRLLQEQTRIRLRDEVISLGRHRRPTEPAPKSRRFVSENEQPKYPLGWIELEEK